VKVPNAGVLMTVDKQEGTSLTLKIRSTK